MQFCRILEWGKSAYMGSETYKPVEESYDKGSAFKMFKVRKSSRAVVVTPFKHSKSGGNSKVYPTTQSVMYSFRSRFQLQV